MDIPESRKKSIGSPLNTFTTIKIMRLEKIFIFQVLVSTNTISTYNIRSTYILYHKLDVNRLCVITKKDLSNFKKWSKIVFAKPKNTPFLLSGKVTLATPLKNPILPDTSDLSSIGFLPFYRVLFVGLARHQSNFEKKYRGFYY